MHPEADAAPPVYISLTESQIETAAGALQKIRPAYGPIIEFYSRIFRAQATSMAHINPEPIIIEKTSLALKAENDMPLITPVEFTIDQDAAEKLIKEICSLADAFAPKLAKSGQRLAQAIDAKTIDLPKLFTDILDGMSIENTAKAINIDTEPLALFGFSAIAPSLQACAEQLTPYLEDMPARRPESSSYCPICGSLPNLALLDESGKKHMSCSLCSHIWQVQRMGCLFCQSNDKKDTHYFFTGEEPEYRVYCCDNCKRYIKTVDIRQLGRRFYPRLELVATLHLDMKAKDKGYIPCEGDTQF